MRFWFTQRVHESIALGAYVAVAVTLHVAWIANWLVARSDWVAEQFTLVEEIGPITGLYLKSVIVFLMVFGLSVLFFRGKDCAPWRMRVLWFFFVSAVLFVFLSFPGLYEFQVSVYSA